MQQMKLWLCMLRINNALLCKVNDSTSALRLWLDSGATDSFIAARSPRPRWTMVVAAGAGLICSLCESQSVAARLKSSRSWCQDGHNLRRGHVRINNCLLPRAAMLCRAGIAFYLPVCLCLSASRPLPPPKKK